jgi:hypothetical protein
MMECHKQRHELIQINRLVKDQAEKGKIDSMINDMRKYSYESIRNTIDVELLKQLGSVIQDERTSAKTYAKQFEVDADKALAQQWYNALKDKTAGDAPKYKKALDKPNWVQKASNPATFADGTSRPNVWKDGSSARSPKKQRDGYKRSPEYNGLKKAYKSGRITKDAFKDGKKVLKSRKR